MTRTVVKGLATAGALSAAAVAPNSLKIADDLFKKIDRKNVQYTLRYLKYRKIVEVKEKNVMLHYRLTKKGHKLFWRISAADLTIKTPRRWDEKWRLVMFDLPVTHSRQRAELLSNLKRLNFLMLQQSAWIHPFSCEKEIGLIIDTLGISRFVTFMVVEDGNFVQYAAKQFKNKKLLV